MIEQIYAYFTIEIIYMWLNIGVLPFWFILIFFNQTRICKIFITSVFPVLIFAIIDLYLIFKAYMAGFNFIDIFNLYLGLDELLNLFSDQYFFIIFWIHFLAINLFCGSWIINDSQRFGVSKFLTFIPLVLTYFIGPFGIFIYWFIKIFYNKKINLYD